jgi:tetratricopeptide (TPR) repeat protein
MHADRYGLPLTTASSSAAAAYVEGVDLLLSQNVGMVEAFERAIAADDEFALAHAGRARALQVHARMAEARSAIAMAERHAERAGAREQGHVRMLALLIGGRSADALATARQHLAAWPRDAMVLAPCTSTFGLIAFSGRQEREAELAALLDGLADAYGDDWWFLGARAFALVECGRLREARPLLERALALHTRNANAAHFNVHLLYEENRVDDGLAFLAEWLPSYPRAAPLHCHLSWHRAMWLHARGRDDEAWDVYRTSIRPGASWGPPLNALTDSASFLWQAELDGRPREPDQWRCVADYVPAVASGPGLAFADVHALLAFAALGDDDRFASWQGKLDELVREDRLPAGRIVPALGDAWRACARNDWTTAASIIAPLIPEHPRIGGSRAQRDLIERTFATAALRARMPPEALGAVRERVRASFARPS